VNTLLRRLWKEEGGFALILGLGAMIALAITVTAVIEYTSSNSRSANVNSAQMQATHAAEAALLAAYSKLNYWDWSSNTGNNATDPTLLGCAQSGASSDCTTSKTLTCVSVTSTCSSSTTDRQEGTGSYFGSYDGTSFLWTISAFGYARNPTGASVIKKTITATSGVYWDTNTPPNIAIWNHLYSTAPQSPSSCEFDVGGNSVVIDVPVYVTGDMCLSGQGASVRENTAGGGQAVDLRVVGKLVFSGNGSFVGYNSSNPGPAITSGGIGLGCTTTTNGSPTSCTSGAFDYHVGNISAVQTLMSPNADYTWYDNADPGPKHTCQSGTNPAAPSGGNPFESAGSTVRDNSAPSFNVTPSTAYSCLSQTGTGQLSWAPPTGQQTMGTLTVSGVVFFDGPIQFTQSALYSGKGTIYASGTITFPNQNTYICAVANCDFNSWDPNVNMMMLASLYTSNPTAAIKFTGNTDKFQGSLFTTPDGLIDFNGQSLQIEGPVVGGKFAYGNNVTMKPLPTINKLPPGAPVALNAHATPGRLSYTGGN
jgi:Tfp pilus assembly protein PilX